LWEFLPAHVEGDLLFAAKENGQSGLPPYMREAWHLWRRRYDLTRYEVVFAWELRSLVAVALQRQWCKLRRKPVGKLVAVGPILKGPVLRALPLLRWLFADVSHVVCFSRAECDEYARLLGLNRDRFHFLRTPWRSDEEVSETDEGYILALGQSGRDYATLLRAVNGTDLPVVIVAGSPSALGGVNPPAHVRVLYNTGHDETNRLIANATLHCIPLYPNGYSAGQTVLLRAMARGKAVVVTDTAGIRDYVKPGETAVTVAPGESGALQKALLSLWNQPHERTRLGRNAARAVREEFGFARFVEQLEQVATRPVHSSSDSSRL
jgi:glycosyltransferase involved in cell wall biosynthesis